MTTKEKSVLVEKTETIECSSSSLSSNDILTTIYDITRAIFRHLPIRSVDSCSLVCKSWAQTAHVTKCQRHTIHSLTYPSDPLSSTTDCSRVLSDFDKFLSSYINNNLWSIPYLALVVATNSLDDKGFYSSPNSPPTPTRNSKRLRSQSIPRQKERVNISQALIRHLNQSCQMLMVSSDGIIASDDQNNSNEIESNESMGMGILLFPKFPPNIFGIRPFEIGYNAQIPANMSRSDLHQFLGGIPDHLPIRCVIFFFIRHQSHTFDCIRKLLEYYPSVVIIGGFADKVYYNNRRDREKKTSNACGMILTGDENHLNIRQVVLENHIHTRDDIKNKLKQLKTIEKQSLLSFAIQISCIARGSDFYDDEKNVECSEFRKIFPNTPLIGIFGNGEIGHDHLIDQNQTSQQQQKRKNHRELFLTYSTVFSLISIHL